ncbi:MAG: MoaD/ThiS family protein [Betaproteobacteria bacterium]
MSDSLSSAPFAVRVVYLARLHDALGVAGETLTLCETDAPTVDTIVATLGRRGGAWADELAPGRAVRFAVNQRIAGRAQTLKDGDEVAIFPPVTGG